MNITQRARPGCPHLTLLAGPQGGGGGGRPGPSQTLPQYYMRNPTPGTPKQPNPQAPNHATGPAELMRACRRRGTVGAMRRRSRLWSGGRLSPGGAVLEATQVHEINGLNFRTIEGRISLRSKPISFHPNKGAAALRHG